MDWPDLEPGDLRRSLEAIRRTQTRWLSDLATTVSGDPRFLDAFRRWQEALTLLKLQVHRAEGRLLHLLLLPEDRRPWRDLPGPPRAAGSAPIDEAQVWTDLISGWSQAIHLDTVYRRLADPLDLADEAINADIVTDLAEVAGLCQRSNRALEHLAGEHDPAVLEDLAFYHVLAPWKRRGLPALRDVLAWVHGVLTEAEAL